MPSSCKYMDNTILSSEKELCSDQKKTNQTRKMEWFGTLLVFQQFNNLRILTHLQKEKPHLFFPYKKNYINQDSL